MPQLLSCLPPEMRMARNGALAEDAFGAPLGAAGGATAVRPALVTLWVGRTRSLTQEPGLRLGVGFGGLNTPVSGASSHCAEDHLIVMTICQ